MTSLATTLQVIQSRNIVHRDIQPNNVCVLETSEGLQTTLINFGFANDIKEIKSVATVQNTVKSSLPDMSTTVMNVNGTSYIVDAKDFAYMCETLARCCSLRLPEKLKIWIENVRALNPEERMGISELVNILEKLQEKEPSPSPAILHGEVDLTYQPTIKSPSCQRENIHQDSPKKDGKRKREDESENTMTIKSKKRRDDDDNEGDQKNENET
ncbi:hypothetical protein OTU49_014280 [Cherax quadricarinatus]|uniref:Protein kinase domain-containing protein n=1 Tax=Cherax quadricarinatus TaxID=27406 RepID=A0AAW0VQF5_CHEQU